MEENVGNWHDEFHLEGERERDGAGRGHTVKAGFAAFVMRDAGTGSFAARSRSEEETTEAED